MSTRSLILDSMCPLIKVQTDSVSASGDMRFELDQALFGAKENAQLLRGLRPHRSKHPA